MGIFVYFGIAWSPEVLPSPASHDLFSGFFPLIEKNINIIQESI